MPQVKRKAQAWNPEVGFPIELRSAARRLADLQPILKRLVDALGNNGAARLLGADPAQVSRWKAGNEALSAEMGRRVLDLNDVLTRILRLYSPEAAGLWLVGSEPLLGGARPVDVLAMHGAAPVIAAIDGIASGAFA